MFAADDAADTTWIDTLRGMIAGMQQNLPAASNSGYQQEAAQPVQSTEQHQPEQEETNPIASRFEK